MIAEIEIELEDSGEEDLRERSPSWPGDVTHAKGLDLAPRLQDPSKRPT